MAELRGHLSAPDYFMLIGYFVLMLGIGAYFYRHMKAMKDYFTGSNTIPWWLSGVSFYMTSFSVAAFTFYPGLCYRHGWVGITLLWVAVPATFVSAGLFARHWRRARVSSPVEFLETRYSPGLRQVFAWQGIPVMLIDDGIKLFATGNFVSVCTGMSMPTSILLCGGIMLIYTFMGGLWAVAVTDFIQFVVLTVGLLVIFPLSVSKAGGLGAIFQNAPEGFFRMTSPEFGWSYVIPLVLLYTLSWSVNWALVQRYYCVPKEKDAIKVGWCVIALYIIGPPLMFFPAIAGAQFLPKLADAGQVYPILCAQLLPAGMLGLAIAAMFAATMSTLSGHYNVCASVLTNDVYHRLIHRNASQRELVFVGRVMTVVVGVVALGIGFLLARGKAEDLFRMMVTLFGIATAPVAIPMILGLVSRRATSLSAMLGFIIGISLGLALFALSRYQHDIVLGGIAWIPASEDVVFWGFALKMEIVMFLGTAVVTLAVMLVISALAPVTSGERSRIEPFLKRLQTPVGEMEGDNDSLRSSTRSLSPFRVVGVCTFVIGLMMLAVVPWSPDRLVLMIDLMLSALLIVVGGLMAWLQRSPAAA